ncbi:hypothetical protein PF002_g31791 [Phytophthora fragariae]|uniref:Uncharacterized protein n=1 Tax=Phytophthora fragariae TaxID=53985 RepID=A0A6A3TER0_9STRA|nr:hypothetical protein PF003_g8104 [Phytophthora fragariae]KAE9134908.1 hypothetical protein PF006_g14727 [Phytophthora fragariae]KAE9146834.1 hypothetical protein PF004_g33004 [Phytophthora fragariae]KAE9163697.1 hypothetical protein PF002_g31791 [Phytophthora fragariae]
MAVSSCGSLASASLSCWAVAPVGGGGRSEPLLQFTIARFCLDGVVRMHSVGAIMQGLVVVKILA